MSEPLITYLHDHLSGAQVAIQILQAMRDHHDAPVFRAFAKNLLPEVEADDQTLRAIAEAIGSGPSVVKQAGGWLLEKLARLKLGHTGSTDLGTFESLELCCSGYTASCVFGKPLRLLPLGIRVCSAMTLRRSPVALISNTPKSRTAG